MKKAHNIKKFLNVSLSEALKQAWAYFKLKARFVGDTVVRFSFVKKNGELREAYGVSLQFAGITGTGKRQPKPTIFTYFDTQKNAVRCFHISQLVKES